MGTRMENHLTKSFQDQLEELRGRLGWSQRRLARELFVELHDTDDEQEIQRFTERFKKELKRSTTCPARLEQYLDILTRHPDLEKLDIVHNRYIPTGELKLSIQKGMKSISRELTEKLR